MWNFTLQLCFERFGKFVTSNSGDPGSGSWHHVPQHISTAKFQKRRCACVCVYICSTGKWFFSRNLEGACDFFNWCLSMAKSFFPRANNGVSPCSVNNHAERGHVPWKLILPSHELMKVMVQLGGGNSNIFYFHPETWGRFPIWLIFFRWVETTNQKRDPDFMDERVAFLYPNSVFVTRRNFCVRLFKEHNVWTNGLWISDINIHIYMVRACVCMYIYIQ